MNTQQPWLTMALRLGDLEEALGRARLAAVREGAGEDEREAEDRALAACTNALLALERAVRQAREALVPVPAEKTVPYTPCTGP